MWGKNKRQKVANFNSAKGQFINELLENAEQENPVPVTPGKDSTTGRFDVLKVDEGSDLRKVLDAGELRGTYKSLKNGLSFLRKITEDGEILREIEDQAEDERHSKGRVK